MEVSVRDNNVEQAIRVLKKKMQREGVFREVKLRNSYEKPSEKKAREKSEAIRRARKLSKETEDKLVDRDLLQTQARMSLDMRVKDIAEKFQLQIDRSLL